MRRTNKRKKFSKKTRLTKKKRFGKRGGVRKNCPFCNKEFIIMSIYDSNYDAHIKTHPKCKYCGSIFKDKNDLITHFLNNHKDKYDVANSINLINELKNNNLDLNEFYTRIENKEKSNEKKAAEKAKKIEQEEQKRLQIEKEAAKKIARQTAIAEQSKIKAEQEEQAKIKEEEERIRQSKIRSQKEAEKAEKERLSKIKEEEEKEAKRLEKLEADRIKKATKRAAKDAIIAERELTSMGQEDELANQLRQAQNVEEVFEIVENNVMSASVPEFIPTTFQQMLNLFTILTEEDLIYLNISKWYTAIQNLYPALKSYTLELNNNRDYKDVSYFIIFIIGVINNRLKEKNLDVKLILKGGKSAQMIMSEHGINNQSILSDDVDILLVKEGAYNYNYLLNFAEQIAVFINNFFNEQLSILIPPDPILTNPNIVKISFFDRKYIPLSDIDFKNIDSEFFYPENIISNQKYWNVYDNNKNIMYTYTLLYYHQSLEAFINEKKYYKEIYNNVIQKKSETENCDCSITEIHDNECKKICSYRNLMIEKFNKYILPLEQLLQMVNNKV
jgi:hypothetical protein